MDRKQSEAKPLTPKGQRTRRKILDAARQVFSSSGYVGMRMSDVAVVAELSLGALYRYFEQKDDLFLTLIQDIHEELYGLSRTGTAGAFRQDPYSAMYRANLGYMQHYFDNREVMRAFIEASMVDVRYRDMWWYMRDRHVKRVVAALARDFEIEEIGDVSAEKIIEALASTTEQSAFVWFAQEALSDTKTDVVTATKTITNIWHSAIFGVIKK